MRKLNDREREIKDLRENINSMTREQMIEMRDELEANWRDSMRAELILLSEESLYRYGVTIGNLKKVIKQ